ncbi:MAG: hypothetical protein Q9212_000063 [Teloschistes hypoglaucus]
MPKKTKSYSTNERTPLTRASRATKAPKTLTITSEDDESFTIPIPNEYEVEVTSVVVRFHPPDDSNRIIQTPPAARPNESGPAIEVEEGLRMIRHERPDPIYRSFLFVVGILFLATGMPVVVWLIQRFDTSAEAKRNTLM